MRVLINTNEQISAAMLERHFQASGLSAEVTSAPNDMMAVIGTAVKMDLVALYADDIDNEALVSFFRSVGSVGKILFVKKQNISEVSLELEEQLDECFTLPLDSGDLMFRLRRMFRHRDAGESAATDSEERTPLKEAEPAMPLSVDFSAPPAVQPQTAAAYQVPVYSPPSSVPVAEAPMQQQVQYQPAYDSPRVQPFQTPPAPVAPPVPVTPIAPAVQTAPAIQVAPINTAFAYTPQDFTPDLNSPYLFNEPVRRDLPEQSPLPPQQMPEGEAEVGEPAPDKKVRKKKRSKDKSAEKSAEEKSKKGKKDKLPLRRLNKTELFEIILEQEKLIESLETELSTARDKLEERNIQIETSGSIAEAALKLNGVFEAAQRSADQYLENIKAKAANVTKRFHAG
ncbi:MAG: hypothetical protein ACOYJX_06725 [Acutalibacteraceae bacterium]|jgi:hypothetical protein